MNAVIKQYATFSESYPWKITISDTKIDILIFLLAKSLSLEVGCFLHNACSKLPYFMRHFRTFPFCGHLIVKRALFTVNKLLFSCIIQQPVKRSNLNNSCDHSITFGNPTLRTICDITYSCFSVTRLTAFDWKVSDRWSTDYRSLGMYRSRGFDFPPSLTTHKST